HSWSLGDETVFRIRGKDYMQDKKKISSEDGPGIQCVLYFRITKETIRALQDPESASEAIRLWLHYCQQAEVDDNVKGRFKV
ncbi:unnamed protein product, partial [Choristocarpus tenellus]